MQQQDDTYANVFVRCIFSGVIHEPSPSSPPSPSAVFTSLISMLPPEPAVVAAAAVAVGAGAGAAAGAAAFSSADTIAGVTGARTGFFSSTD